VCFFLFFIIIIIKHIGPERKARFIKKKDWIRLK